MKGKTQWLLPGLLVFGLDRASKGLLDGMRQTLVPGLLALHGVHNTGMALGLMQGQTGLVLLLSAVLAALCGWMLRKTRLTGLMPCALSLIAGGALGNLYDRLVLGYVIDLFEFLFVDFYIFNAADVGVVAGAVLCAVSLLFRPGDWSKR